MSNPFDRVLDEIAFRYLTGQSAGEVAPDAVITLKNCPGCGAIPSFGSQHATYGHGDSATEWYVQCQCGIRTKGIPTGREGTDAQCKQKAAEIWNRRATGPRAD